jgi:hypothetical protein
MFSSGVFRSILASGLLLLGLGLLAGCSSLAAKNRPQDEILAERLKSSENGCIRLQQAEDEAVKAGQSDAQSFHEARLKACQQYEQDKQALDQFQSQHASPFVQGRQP